MSGQFDPDLASGQFDPDLSSESLSSGSLNKIMKYFFLLVWEHKTKHSEWMVR